MSGELEGSLYRRALKPTLFALPAESAHELAIAGLRWWSRALRMRGVQSPALDPRFAVRAMGLDFPNPVLMAAGFDKQAEAYEALFALGFGGVEIGTITNEPQAGNPRPRLFRLPEDRALLNRMGFNNCGADVAAERLRAPRSSIVGVNVGKTKRVPEEQAIADYVASVEKLAPLADYVVVNVSSPNTPGLRNLQAVDRLRPLLEAVNAAIARVCRQRLPPLLVKIAPDLTDDEVVAVADLSRELGLAGVVATNTTIQREGLKTDRHALERLGAGGISGAPLKRRAFEVLKLLRERLGPEPTIVSVGGIETADEAWERLSAGADLLQVYTAFVYEGPALPRRLVAGLFEHARRAGHTSLAAALRRAQPEARAVSSA